MITTHWKNENVHIFFHTQHIVLGPLGAHSNLLGDYQPRVCACNLGSHSVLYLSVHLHTTWAIIFPTLPATSVSPSHASLMGSPKLSPYCTFSFLLDEMIRNNYIFQKYVLCMLFSTFWFFLNITKDMLVYKGMILCSDIELSYIPTYVTCSVSIRFKMAKNWGFCLFLIHVAK